MQPTKKTLVLGATPNPNRYAYIATEMLRDFGHTVIPFGIKKGQIGAVEILNEWPTDAEVDTVTLYINTRIQEGFYEQIVALKPRRIIFNPGTENSVLQNLATSQKIETIDACTLVLLQTNQY
ncbi:MAG TPA: CoA-binding protein [Bacteroidetes bacterium]|jgi:uncharacterized protein|nr:CoA-binding protein [Bacteroidota bacterium]|tara:strand:- start:979 stop:1347 length:369 start_codon:yes stop_codon:yes gene_type:complete